MNFYHVVYMADSVLGSIQIADKQEVLSILDLTDYIRGKTDADQVILINWIKLHPNQVDPKFKLEAEEEGV